jgi:hypothetical protein
MWDKLPEIQQHSMQGSKLLSEFSIFTQGYNQALTKFSSEIKKISEIFNKNLAKYEKKNGPGNLVDHSYFGYGKTGSEFKK